MCHFYGGRYLMSIQVSFSNSDFFLFILEMSDFFCCAFVFFSLSSNYKQQPLQSGCRLTTFPTGPLNSPSPQHPPPPTDSSPTPPMRSSLTTCFYKTVNAFETQVGEGSQQDMEKFPYPWGKLIWVRCKN